MRTGNYERGADRHNAIFDGDDIRNIRQLAREGIPLSQIAEKWESKYSTVWDIVNYRRWTHVQ